MSKFDEFQIARSYDDEESAYVRERLIEYNASQVDKALTGTYEPINLIIKNNEGRIVAGLLAVRYWDCMQVDILWVDETYRGDALGVRLLAYIEQAAIQKDCRFIQLDTFSFQAPEFYKKYGYQAFGIAEDIHGGHSRYYFIKRIQRSER